MKPSGHGGLFLRVGGVMKIGVIGSAIKWLIVSFLFSIPIDLAGMQVDVHLLK